MPSDPVHPAPPSPDLPLIELRDIRVHYQVDASLGIDHSSWQPGQRWAVLGGNGSGKTTLARLLADELRPARGRHDSPRSEERRVGKVRTSPAATLISRMNISKD